MTPPRSGPAPRSSPPSPRVHEPTDDDYGAERPSIFLDPMLGTPLYIFISPDVENRIDLVKVIHDHGGIVLPGYSGVPYILVNSSLPSGQSLYRQYAGKKGKLVLDARWVDECVIRGALQTYTNNWADCRVTGDEMTDGHPADHGLEDASGALTSYDADMRSATPTEPTAPSFYEHPAQAEQDLYRPSIYAQPAHVSVPSGPPDSAPRYMTIPPTTTPSCSWPDRTSDSPGSPGLSSSVPPGSSYRPEGWGQFDQADTPPSGHFLPHHDWASPDAHHESQYAPWPPDIYSVPQIDANGTNRLEVPSAAGTSSASAPLRGRRRTRVVPQPVTSSSASLKIYRRGSLERSPTPPTQVVKSTYGGNVFTAQDVEYLKTYIDYCQRQGLVLSLREICERLAVKCPHHTFYSWRRYCNKHQIRLQGYQMDADAYPSPSSALPAPQEASVDAQLAHTSETEDDSIPGPSPQPQPLPCVELQPHSSIPSPLPVILPQTFILSLHGPPGQLPMLPSPALPSALASLLQSQLTPVPLSLQSIISVPLPRIDTAPLAPSSRSPSPPKALFRSTTGKGVAFTQQDVDFLVAFLRHRRQSKEGQLDMVAFWNDVVARCPHHSRASWMKYYRRHKHELFPEAAGSGGAVSMPLPPDKKLRYGRADDVLIAQYLFTRPEGTSDKIYQEFARQHPHHPWKGWQEHARIHKAAIEHLVKCLERGEVVDLPTAANGGTARATCETADQVMGAANSLD